MGGKLLRSVRRRRRRHHRGIDEVEERDWIILLSDQPYIRAGPKFIPPPTRVRFSQCPSTVFQTAAFAPSFTLSLSLSLYLYTSHRRLRIRLSRTWHKALSFFCHRRWCNSRISARSDFATLIYILIVEFLRTFPFQALLFAVFLVTFVVRKFYREKRKLFGLAIFTHIYIYIYTDKYIICIRERHAPAALPL